jgi:trehalose synthase
VNVNSTARGGGVAEMLASLLSYVRGAGLDARWLVISGDPDFFRITKRIHNRLHGEAGDGGPLGDAERAHYQAILALNAEALVTRVHPGDIVILHDPQTAGLVGALRRLGAGVFWRCHIGIDEPNRIARDTQNFLLPYVRDADVCIFSREAFIWEGLDRARTRIIPPSIDCFSTKNRELEPENVRAILAAAGIIEGTGSPPLVGHFERADGSPGRIERQATLVGAPLPHTARTVTQVSRWDRLKDPRGVLRGFAIGPALRSDAHLVLAAPSVEAVGDDPEGAAVLAEVTSEREALSAEVRDRVHLVSLPMDDPEENAAMVNALQRHSEVVVQKSLAEGFGLTVAEAMWKARPVVASRVGGIQDQIQDGVTGILLDDPRDLDAFAAAVVRLLADPDAARLMGERARERVRAEFLAPRHLLQYLELCGEWSRSEPG